MKRHRQLEDIEEMDRLNQENSRLLVENRELKEKLERKKGKIQYLKENLATALVSINDVERIRYENEQRDLQHAALQNAQLAPFCEMKKEEESSIPFDDVGERIIVRDGKKIKQVKHHRGLDSNGEEVYLYQECEMTKWEIEEIEKETEKRKLSEAEKQQKNLQFRTIIIMSASFSEMEKNTSSGSSLDLVLTFGMEKKKLPVCNNVCNKS